MTDDVKNRVMIFIDGSNFYHSCKDSFSIHHYNVDFIKLINLLVGNRMLVKVRYYNASLDRGMDAEKYWGQQKFFEYLRKLPGFEVVLCRMRKDRNKSGNISFAVKGDDINIASDMVGDAYENIYDTAILISGDGDFVPAIKRVQKIGKIVENAYFVVSFSNHLKGVCNKSVEINKEMINKCIKKSDK
ncbi:MAG: NYN domain-containing protein [Candidatus Aenigmarchaeota archaeon]|nr:NYN domain-containing protein [Candidatus Aenigmarchaeota archaeon]